MPSSPTPQPPSVLSPEEEINQYMTLTDDISDFDTFSTPSSTARNSFPQSLTISRTNSTQQARRIASRYNLGPYARDLEDYTQEDSKTQSVLLFARMLSIEQKVTSLMTSSQTNFTPGKALMDNIKSYVHAVLISPNLVSFKGNIAWKRVLAVIKHFNINTPSNLDTDRNVFKGVKNAVTRELTQCRSRIKKAIASSRNQHQSVYQLALTLVENTQVVVTVELALRLALLRKVHAEGDNAKSPKYWDAVNDRLKYIKKASGGDSKKVDAILKRYLMDDRAKYGNVSHQTARGQNVTHWQTSIDTAMTGPTEASPLDDDDEDDEENQDDELDGTPPPPRQPEDD